VQCHEASSKREPRLFLEGGSSNVFVTAAKVRGSSLFVHVVLVHIIEEIVVSDK